MDNINKGSWIINTTKHLNDYKTNAHELDSFASTSFAGRASLLLSKLTANNQEIVKSQKIKVIARDSFIDPQNVESYLKALKQEGMVDYSVDNLDRPKEVEVYCFSNSTAVSTATKIFEKRVEDDIERANIDLLQSTYNIPMKREEIKEELSNNKGYKENSVNTLLELHRVLKITKENKGIIYNEYTFTGNQERLVTSLTNLNDKEKQIVTEIVGEVSEKQGYLYENLKSKYDKNILKMMEGIGMLEGIEVASAIGNAVFVTTPQIRGTGIGEFSLSTDIFHKAKMLLSCLRFGQDKSEYGRGKISTEEKMLNIIRKLNRGEWLNPCTAAGQDYTLLEREGVIEVEAAYYGMYRMKLRQLEVGKLVEQMIEYNRIVSLESESSDALGGMSAIGYVNPEVRRSSILAESNPSIQELQDKVLQAIRG